MCFYLLCIGQPELRYYDNRRQACGSGPGYIHLGHPGGQLCGEGNGDAFLELVIVSLLHKAVFFPLKAGLEIGEMILAVNKDSLVGSNYDTVSIRKSSRYLLFLLFSFRPLAVSAVRPSFVRFLPRRLFTLLLYPHQLCNIFTVLILIFHNTPLC
jgi:hypothetical protein